MKTFNNQSKASLLLREFERLHKVWFNTSRFTPQSAIARNEMDYAWRIYQLEKENQPK